MAETVNSDRRNVWTDEPASGRFEDRQPESMTPPRVGNGNFSGPVACVVNLRLRENPALCFRRWQFGTSWKRLASLRHVALSELLMD